jgi:anhydro-N-acetylmuramic acid kinase
MTIRWVIGLSAGPSADGVDAALLEVHGQAPQLQVRVAGAMVEPHAKDLRELLIRASTAEQGDVRQVSLANRLLGETFAQAARRVADRASISLQNILCIGCTGHTAWHEADSRYPSTLSLGLPAILAERTGLTTISDFRARDLSCGGQGAPLSAAVDELLFRSADEDRLLIHLGGLAQVVYLPAGNGSGSVVGWEAGPCNILLDCLMQQVSGGKERFDVGGKHAVQGRQIPELLRRWSSHPFLLRRPPRSTHRQCFAEEFARQTVAMVHQCGLGMHDLLCSAHHFVVRSIVDSLQRYLPRNAAVHRVLLSGGGVRNGLLWRLLEEQLPGVTLARTDTLSVPFDAREPTTAALLACLLLDRYPANLPLVTGASGARLLGSITPGSMANWSRCLAWMNDQTESVYSWGD